MQTSRVKPGNQREGAGRYGWREGGRDGTRAKSGNQLVILYFKQITRTDDFPINWYLASTCQMHVVT